MTEGGEATFWVRRNSYSQGAVSVTVRVAAGGTAEQVESFTLEPVSPTGGAFGWLGALLFGIGGALRRRRIRNR